VARTFPFFAAGAAALAAASLAAAAPQRPAAIQPSAQIRQLAQAAAKQRWCRASTRQDRPLLQLRPDQAPLGNKLAPIWTVTNGAAGQHNIIDTVPGEKGYTPLWQVSK